MMLWAIILEVPVPAGDYSKYPFMELASAGIALFVLAATAIAFIKGQSAKPFQSPTAAAATNTQVYIDGPIAKIIDAVNGLVGALSQLPVILAQLVAALVDNNKVRGEMVELKREVERWRDKDKEEARLEYDDIRNDMKKIEIDVVKASTRMDYFVGPNNRQP